MQIHVDGRTAYAYTGARTVSPSQPTVAFVHGAASDHSVWALQSRYFAHHGLNVLAVDLPGHGRSAGPALASVEAIARWIVRMLDAAEIASATLVGHSLGALACLAATAESPARVRKLALLGPAVPMPVSDVLLDAAKADDHAAFELINGWSHSAARRIGGNRVPGMWMTGAALRLMERTPPGVLHTDLSACNAYAAWRRRRTPLRCARRSSTADRSRLRAPVTR
jgi:pimeloyl-ACP methyl ester carboxylesterase